MQSQYSKRLNVGIVIEYTVEYIPYWDYMHVWVLKYILEYNFIDQKLCV